MDILNQVKDLLVDFANKNGINLQDEFGSVENFKKFVISLCFKALTDNGVDIKTAYDMLLGDGAYERLATDVWNAAQSS